MTLPWSTLTSKILSVAGLVIIVAGLHLGQDFLVPLALSILFSLILSPLVSLGLKLKLPRTLSVITVVVLVFGFLGLVSYFIAGQAAALGKKLPEYKSNAKAKLESLRVPFARTLLNVQEAVKDAQGGSEGAPPPRNDTPARTAQDPVKVEVVEGHPDALKVASNVLGPLMTAGASFAAVVLMVIFFLLYKDDIRDRVIRLVGDAQVNMTTQTITEATRGVSRFLFLQAAVNASYGVTLGLGLLALGVPNALLWGFLAAVLRFIPYVGPIAGGVLPVLLSVAVFPGWTRPLLVAGFIALLEVISNNYVEPVVYGKRTGLSPVAVVLAAIFWAWMWGALGLIVAVPLTVCLLSLGKYVPSLRFLAVVLGDEPALEPKVQVYHRLLTGHQEEAVELLEKELAQGKPLAELYDQTVLWVLRMAETDLQQGKLDPEKSVVVFEALREITDDLTESALSRKEKVQALAGLASEPPPEPCTMSALCLPASDKADEVSAHMLAQVLNLRGCRAKVVPVENMAGETMEAVQAEGADVLVICTSPPSNLLRARYLYKRLRRQFGEIPIVEGVWGSGDARSIEDRIAPDHKATLVTSLVEAEKVVVEMSREATARKKIRAGAA